MPGAIHIPSDHPSPDRPAKAHSRRTAKSTAVSSAPSCKQTPKSSLDGPSAKLLVVGTMQKYGVVFRSDSGKVPWWLIRLACLESADPFIQLCLAPSLSMKTSTWRSRSNPPQQDKAKLHGNTSASKTRFCLTPPPDCSDFVWKSQTKELQAAPPPELSNSTAPIVSRWLTSSVYEKQKRF